MPAWKTAICETNGISIHYTRSGGAGRPVVLLHGLAANGLCWSALTRVLEGEYDIIMPDGRGHGRSSTPETGYRYDDLAEDAAGLIRDLRLAPAFLVGHSMGGLTAAVVASRYPGLLRGVILADPTFLSAEMQRQVCESDVADQHRRMLSLSLEEIMAEARARHPQRSAELVELIARARLQTSLNAFEVLRQPYPDYRQVVGAITVPALLVIAEHGVVSPEAAAELQKLNPRVRVASLPEAGHGLQYDQPERFAAIVRTFLGTFEGAA